MDSAVSNQFNLFFFGDFWIFIFYIICNSFIVADYNVAEFYGKFFAKF